MKKILNIVISLLLALTFVIILSNVSFAVDENLNIWNSKQEWSQVQKNDHLKNIKNSEDWGVRKWWERWIYNTLVRVSRDLKNVFFAIAGLFYLAIVFKIIFASNSEEEFTKFKKWIIWITVWIVIMQVAYSFVKILFDKNIWESLASDLIKDLIFPLLEILQIWASFFFIAIAILTFYKMITANGDEEKVKTGKNSIIYSVIWFLIIKFSKAIVESVYGKIDCNRSSTDIIQYNSWECINRAELSWFADVVVTIINWMNNLVWILIVIMIIYAWAQILFSGWDDEKLKKTKSSITYIIIWVFILIVNYLILTFFIIPEKII